MHMLRKGQLEVLAKRDILAQNRVINQLFGLAASRAIAQPLLTPSPFHSPEGESAPPRGVSPDAYAHEGGRVRAGMESRHPVLCTTGALPSQGLAFDSKMSYTSRARLSAHFSSNALGWLSDEAIG
jgi:hypothetical protein